MERIIRWLAWIFAAWCAILTVFVSLAQAITTDPITRAVLRMALGVVVFWIIGGGLLSIALRQVVLRWFRLHARGWQLLFVVSATAMALLEEAVTTTMTNLAPYWGLTIAQAHITASGNYLDVVLLHSVIVFIPMYAAWSWIMRRYAFTPPAVFVLYGLTGALLETVTFGSTLLQVGFWVYVYGLMVYLPAHAAPPQRIAKSPGPGAALLAIVLPIVAAIPMVIVVQIIHRTFFGTLP